MQILIKGRGNNPLSPYNLTGARIAVNDQGQPVRIFYPTVTREGYNVSALGVKAGGQKFTSKRFEEESFSRANKAVELFPGMQISRNLDPDKIMANTSNGICHICGNPFQNGDKVSPDHLDPLSRGGNHVEDNLRHAHFECNRLRSDTPLTPEQLARTHLPTP